MASNSATLIPTQQSVKAYVDSQSSGASTLTQVLTAGNSTSGSDIVLTSGDKITGFTSTGIDDNATSNALTIDTNENVFVTKTVTDATVVGWSFGNDGRGTQVFDFSGSNVLVSHVNVKNASLELGMLNIHLERELPEALKPKTIKINDGLTIDGESK